MGDPTRLFIGGKDSLYRVKEYTGDWVENQKHGRGVMTYFNGDKIDGPFVQGQPHGQCIYVFATTNKIRNALYVRGERIKFVDETLDEIKRKMAKFKFLAQMKGEEDIPPAVIRRRQRSASPEGRLSPGSPTTPSGGRFSPKASEIKGKQGSRKAGQNINSID